MSRTNQNCSTLNYFLNELQEVPDSPTPSPSLFEQLLNDSYPHALNAYPHHRVDGNEQALFQAYEQCPISHNSEEQFDATKISSQNRPVFKEQSQERVPALVIKESRRRKRNLQGPKNLETSAETPKRAKIAKAKKSGWSGKIILEPFWSFSLSFPDAI